jgi:hypothetical protein
MESDYRRSQVRRRLLPAGIGFLAFAVLGGLGSDHFWSESWFYIGLGTVLSATFVEPFFAKPQDAIVNSAGGIGAVASVETAPITELWLAFLAVLILILVAGATAAIAAGDRDRTVKWAAFRLATRLGRAGVIGPSALSLVVLTRAAKGEGDFQLLAAATAILAVAVAVDWYALVVRFSRRREVATTVAAIGPRMLLVAAGSDDFSAGDLLALETTKGTAKGSVVARLPHPDGLRYQVSLDREWSALCGDFPDAIVLEKEEGTSGLVGSVGQGTTERSLAFDPFKPLSVGDPVYLLVDNRTLLYQVARLQLTSASWLGGNAVVAHATAQIIGWPEGDRIFGGSYLPQPHDAVYKSENLAGSLPDGYYEIGKVKGTEIPVGLQVDSNRRGHLAILGMSGMGKTAVAQRVCRKLGEQNVVVALDTTGEYATRLGFPAWTNSFSDQGHFVYEPEGDPPLKAAEFFKSCMQAGADEYKSGENPQPRVVLFEEAHGFVPEWNFALRHQQDQVALTTRGIMQARKFGITVVMVSQRTAVVSKSALSQCENYIILKTLDQTSLDYLEALVGADMRHAIPSLKRYEALCVGPAFNAEEPVIVTLSPP